MSYLDDRPWTTKDTKSGVGNGHEFALASMQGWRTGMEDTYVAELNPAGLPEGCSFFAVFDGHGGYIAADLASKNVIEQLANVMTTDVFPDGKAEDADPNKIGKAMRDAFMNLDQKISDLFETSPNPSGCTAIAALITPTHIIVANAGDSRSVMAKAGRTVTMSFDHKPVDYRERTRIENAGGCLVDCRVDGDLSVSRGLGDFRYKACANLPAEQQQVSAEPDIEVHKIDKTEEFLVLACDGIWDVMSNDEVCYYIRDLMDKGKTDLKLIAKELLDNCLRKRSTDNMSVVIVKFPGAKVGEGGGVASIREERARLEKAQRKIAWLAKFSEDGGTF